MINTDISKTYLILKRIRKITLCILAVCSLCFLFILSYYITCNSSSISCDPTELSKQLVTNVNNKNAKKILALTDLNKKTDQNDLINKINSAVQNSNYKSITSSSKQIVVQSNDYLIYNTTFEINDKSNGTYNKTVPIMYIKTDDKWYIDSNSILALLEQ